MYLSAVHMTPHFGKHTVLCFDFLSNGTGIYGGHVWSPYFIRNCLPLNLVLEQDCTYRGVLSDTIPDLMQVTHI